jgi:chaperonin cofactor prefoldin
MVDVDYQKVVDDLDRQNLDVMEVKIEEMAELINTLTKRIEKLESTVAFHEKTRRK